MFLKAKNALKKKGKADEKPAPMAGSKYVHLLDDADVKRWFNFERSNSEITGRERLDK